MWPQLMCCALAVGTGCLKFVEGQADRVLGCGIARISQDKVKMDGERLREISRMQSRGSRLC